MGTSTLPDTRATGRRAERIHKARVPMLQLICYTSSTLKSAQNLMSIFPSVYIVTDSNYDCGSCFCDILHSKSIDCGFYVLFSLSIHDP